MSAETESQAYSETMLEDELKEPSMYRVILHNDDYTTMEFVIMVLVDVFKKTESEAQDIMLTVHKKGAGVCGVYPKEIAEFRVAMVEQMAHKAGFPLRCTMEKV